MRMPTAALTIPYSTLWARATLVLLAVFIGVAMPMSASAQTLRGTSFSTESGDHTMEWDDNWTASLTTEDDFTTMVMLEGQIMIYAAMFIHDENLGLSERVVYQSLSGVLVNSFDSPPIHSIEWQDENGTYNGAHLISLSGIDFVLYLRVDPPTPGTGPTMQFGAAPVRAFPLSLEAMQAEISIDGKPVFDGENGEDILIRLDGEPNQAPTDSEDSAAESSEPSAADSEPAEVSNPLKDRSRQQRDAQINSQPVSAYSYESAQHGFMVEFPEIWENMALDNATIGEFSLQATSGRSVVSFTGRSTTETNRQAFFEDIVARESRYEGYVGSVISDDRLLLATWTADSELAILEYVFVGDSTVVTIMAAITSGNPNRYVPDLQEITLNGDPILRDWEELWPED